MTDGRATFTLDGEEFDAPAGTLVFVADPASAAPPWPPARHHRARRRRPAGPAVQVAPWEDPGRPARRRWRATASRTTARPPTCCGSPSRRIRRPRACSTTSPASRASPAPSGDRHRASAPCDRALRGLRRHRPRRLRLRARAGRSRVPGAARRAPAPGGAHDRRARLPRHADRGHRAGIDGSVPWRAIGMHLDVAAFGVNAFGCLEAGERIVNEHDESDTSHEELYAITQGRARFEVDGEVFDAPAGTFVLVAPQATRTVFAEEDGTALVAFGGEPGKAYQPAAGRCGRRFTRCTRQATTRGVIAQGRELVEANRPTAARSTTSPAARASPATRPTPSSTCARRSTRGRGSARWPRATRTSTRSGAIPRFRSWSPDRLVSAHAHIGLGGLAPWQSSSVERSTSTSVIRCRTGRRSSRRGLPRARRTCCTSCSTTWASRR